MDTSFKCSRSYQRRRKHRFPREKHTNRFLSFSCPADGRVGVKVGVSRRSDPEAEAEGVDMDGSVGALSMFPGLECAVRWCFVEQAPKT
jgi:hypothetical protein